MAMMRPILNRAMTIVSASTLMLGATCTFGIEAGVNPYADIVTRNAFSLKPPEPPKPIEQPKEEVAPSNIIMTGVTTINGKKQVYLKLTTPGEKDPKYLRLGENEREGQIEVTEITPKTGRVRIKNRGVPSIISFDTHGAQMSSAPAAAVAIPGRPPGLPGVTGVPPVPGAVPTANNPATAIPVNSALPASTTPSNIVRPGTAPTAPASSEGTRSLPTRTLRVSPGASYQAPTAPVVDPAVQRLQMEVNSRVQPANFPPMPPTVSQ